MAKPDEVRRLVDDPSAPARLADAVRAARAREPSNSRIAGMASALGVAFLPPAAPPPPVPPPGAPPPAVPAPLTAPPIAAASGGLALAAKGIGVLGAVSAAAIVTTQWLSTARHPVAPSIASTRETVAASRDLPPQAAVDPALDISAKSDEVAPPTIAAAPAPAVAPSRRPRAARPIAQPPAPSAETDEPAITEGPPTDVASRLRDEAALVRRAESLLVTDPAGALRLTAERRQRFPAGALDQEAEVVAIDALLRLGRRGDAEARARTFEAAHAGSLHAVRIRRLLEAR